MDFLLEVLVLPVADVDRSLAFYTDQVGFALDVDYRPSADFRVVQLTPPGSACSVQLVGGSGGPIPGLYLVVADIEAARGELVARGVSVGDIRHKASARHWQGGWEPGADPERRDYASFAEFTDPDGHVWVLQERGN